MHGAVDSIGGRTGAIQPEIDALLLQLSGRALGVDANVKVVGVVAVEHPLHDARRAVQRPESRAHLVVTGLAPCRVVARPRAYLLGGQPALWRRGLLEDRLEPAGTPPLPPRP